MSRGKLGRKYTTSTRDRHVASGYQVPSSGININYMYQYTNRYGSALVGVHIQTAATGLRAELSDGYKILIF